MGWLFKLLFAPFQFLGGFFFEDLSSDATHFADRRFPLTPVPALGTADVSAPKKKGHPDSIGLPL